MSEARVANKQTSYKNNFNVYNSRVSSSEVKMAATSRFEDVLNFISNSKLNFAIYKTPFSAQISLKNSFAKYFKEI